MNRDILRLIEEKNAAFSKGQRAIARYIAEHGEEAAFLTAGRLAKVTGVSESTVVRFALELGFEGYPQMQRSLQGLILERLATENVTATVPGRADMVSALLYDDIKCIETMAQRLDRSAFDQAVQVVGRAERIYVLYSDASAALGVYLRHYLQCLRKNIILLYSAAVTAAHGLAELEAGDVLLVLSLGEQGKLMRQCAALCERLGGSVVAFVDAEEGTLWDTIKCVLPVECGQLGGVRSLAAGMSAANVFAAALTAHCGDAFSTHMQKLERVRTLWQTADDGQEDK